MITAPGWKNLLVNKANTYKTKLKEVSDTDDTATVSRCSCVWGVAQSRTFELYEPIKFLLCLISRLKVSLLSFETYFQIFKMMFYVEARGVKNRKYFWHCTLFLKNFILHNIFFSLGFPYHIPTCSFSSFLADSILLPRLFAASFKNNSHLFVYLLLILLVPHQKHPWSLSLALSKLQRYTSQSHAVPDFCPSFNSTDYTVLFLGLVHDLSKNFSCTFESLIWNSLQCPRFLEITSWHSQDE